MATRGSGSKDWVVSVGLDTSDADTKVKALEAKIKRLSAATSSSRGSRGTSVAQQSSRSKEQTARLKEESRLHKKRESSLRIINKLNADGALTPSELGRERARITNLKDIDKLEANRGRLITKQRTESEKLSKVPSTSTLVSSAKSSSGSFTGSALTNKRESARLATSDADAKVKALDAKVKALEAKIKSLSAATSSSRMSRGSSGAQRAGVSKEQTARLKEENRLHNKREASLRVINKLNASGALTPSELGRERARVSNLKDIDKLEANRGRLITRQRIESEKLSRVPATPTPVSQAKSSSASYTGQALINKRESARLGTLKQEEALKGSLSSIARVDKPSKELLLLKKNAQESLEKVQKLQAQLAKTSSKDEFTRLKNELQALGMTTTKVTSQTKRLTSQFHKQNFAAKGVTSSLRNMARTYLSVFAATAGGLSFFRLGRDMESLQASMLAASGTAAQAAKDFEFVKKTSIGLGVDLKEAASGYTKLGAAARAAGFDSKQTKNVFLAAAESARAFGLNAQRTNLVFLAFGQILSKGKVSMEELRRQLGEQIPGAFQIAAKAMNMTTAELDKLVSTGNLASEDFLPKFADELRKTVRETGALQKALVKVQAEQERFQSTVTLNVDEGFKKGANDFADGFKSLSMSMRTLNSSFNVIGRVLGAGFKIFANILNFISPILAVFTNSLETLFLAFEKAGSVATASDDLTIFEQGLRAIIKTTLYVKIALIELQIAMIKFAEWFGVSEKDASRWGQQLAALIPALLALAGVLYILLIPLRLVLGAVGILRALFGGLGAAKAAGKVGLLTKALQKLKGMVRSIPGLKDILPKTTKASSNVGGIQAALKSGASTAGKVAFSGAKSLVVKNLWVAGIYAMLKEFVIEPLNESLGLEEEAGLFEHLALRLGGNDPLKMLSKQAFDGGNRPEALVPSQSIVYNVDVFAEGNIIAEDDFKETLVEAVKQAQDNERSAAFNNSK